MPKIKDDINMKILFICRHNRFRSKVAEAIFNFYDKGKNRARSRGIIKDIDVADSVIKGMDAKGIRIKNTESVPLKKQDIEWADLIVIVADNVDIDESMNKKAVAKWSIADVSQDDYNAIRETINILEKKVKALISEISE